MLPAEALTCYAELLVFLELTPWTGAPYKDDEPEGAMRTQPFGPVGEGLAVYRFLAAGASCRRAERDLDGLIGLFVSR